MTVVADFNPEMLILARRSREMTQTQLAELSAVSSASVSRYETGTLSATDDSLSRIAAVLKYPVSFFCRKPTLIGATGGAIFHRKQQSLPTRKLYPGPCPRRGTPPRNHHHVELAGHRSIVPA